MKLNDFQVSLAANKEACWEVVKLFHSTINDSKKDSLKITFKYDWVMLSVGTKVDIGIDFECTLRGEGWSINDFEKERKNNVFKAWRFKSDSLCEDDVDTEYMDSLNAILSKHLIKKPTAKQMYDYYYKD